jgi:hypothetical protein
VHVPSIKFINSYVEHFEQSVLEQLNFFQLLLEILCRPVVVKCKYKLQFIHVIAECTFVISHNRLN